MRNYRLGSPPRSLKRSTVHLDNVALVPASLLPLKSQWQAIANSLPRGDILVVVPRQTKHQQIARLVATRLREKGHRVQLLDTKLPSL